MIENRRRNVISLSASVCVFQYSFEWDSNPSLHQPETHYPKIEFILSI